MKRIILFISLISMVTIGVLAQVVDPEIPIPDKWTDLIDINAWFAGMNAVAGIVVFLTAALNTYLIKTETKWVKHGLSIVVAVILTVATGLLNFGYMAGAPWLALVLYGVSTGFLANGWYGVATVKNLLKWVKLAPVPPA